MTACQVPAGSDCDRCGLRADRCHQAALDALRASDPVFAAYVMGETQKSASEDLKGDSGDA